MELPKGIQDYLFQYRIKGLLKQHGKQYSGRTTTVYERLDQAISSDPDFNRKFEDFVVEEISNGRNRQIFLCGFAVESLQILGSYQSVQSNLAASHLPFEPFNNLLNPRITESGTMLYLNIDQTNGQVSQISMAFLREAQIETNDGDGNPQFKTVTDYDWIDIFPQQRYLQIKTRPHSNNYIVNEAQSKQDFEYYWDLMKTIFKVVYTNMSESKNTLYKIFKVLTDKAEAPYAQKVTDNISLIEEKINQISRALALPNSKNPVDIPIRVARLFERALILSDLMNYKAYDREKLGIVDKIDFSDQSGAKVVALSGQEGIEYADIYFDTRETLDELQKLNKLWLTWFLPNPIESDLVLDDENTDEPREFNASENEIERVETRIEVYDNRVIIQFLDIMCAPKEVQDHVLSMFRKFEEGEIS
ncbi:hypothetical protein AMQ84_06430 [Paenibacillus riograndensis]|uniref:Uncharacterized protein n=1 Tax=Paenibacillus riograndensis TaxID=483937 RepID=A0A132U7U3_9BACL|nr:hypothetical protein [Paenibacillus riograndensis]KWX79548.1 hypothetical protein AMQ84_06430 [Paenibacillus riograndensis]